MAEKNFMLTLGELTEDHHSTVDRILTAMPFGSLQTLLGSRHSYSREEETEAQRRSNWCQGHRAGSRAEAEDSFHSSLLLLISGHTGTVIN